MDLTPSGLPFFESSPDGSVHAGLGFQGTDWLPPGSAAASSPRSSSARTTAGAACRSFARRGQLPPEPLHWPMVRTVASGWRERRPRRGARPSTRPRPRGDHANLEAYARPCRERLPPRHRKERLSRHVYSGRCRSHAGGRQEGHVVSAAVALALLLFACGSAAASRQRPPARRPEPHPSCASGGPRAGRPEPLRRLAGHFVPALPHGLRTPHQPGHGDAAAAPGAGYEVVRLPRRRHVDLTIRRG